MQTKLDKAKELETNLKADQYAKFLYWEQMFENNEATEKLEMFHARWIAIKLRALINEGFDRDEAMQLICAQLKR